MSEKQKYVPDQVFDHDFDGIQEYDNRLPNWWLWVLWGTVLFSLVYWLVFHTYKKADLPYAKYEKVMETAGGALASLDARELTEADFLALASDAERISQGEALYTQYCVVCHKERGEGLVGPNLTDPYWINGGTATDIHNTVVNGVLDKGMAAWGRQLGPERVDAVVSYVLTLRNTNVPGKEPQGEVYDPRPAVDEPLEEGIEQEAIDEASAGVES